MTLILYVYGKKNYKCQLTFEAGSEGRVEAEGQEEESDSTGASLTSIHELQYLGVESKMEEGILQRDIRLIGDDDDSDKKVDT